MKDLLHLIHLASSKLKRVGCLEVWFDVIIILNCWVNFYRLIVYFSSFQCCWLWWWKSLQMYCSSEQQNSMIAIHRGQRSRNWSQFWTLAKGSTVQPQVKSFVVKISNYLKIFLLFTNYMFKLLTSSIEQWHEMKNGLFRRSLLLGILSGQSQKWMGVWAKNALNLNIFGQEIPLYECVFKFLTWDIFYVISLKQYYCFFFLEYQHNCNDFVFFTLLKK